MPALLIHTRPPFADPASYTRRTIFTNPIKLGGLPYIKTPTRKIFADAQIRNTTVPNPTTIVAGISHVGGGSAGFPTRIDIKNGVASGKKLKTRVTSEFASFIAAAVNHKGARLKDDFDADATTEYDGVDTVEDDEAAMVEVTEAAEPSEVPS